MRNPFIEKLILESLTLSLGVSSQLEVLSSLNGDLVELFASVALHLQHNLLGGLGLWTGKKWVRRLEQRADGNNDSYLLVENGLGLTTETRLLAIVTSLTLSPETLLTLLVLGNLLRGMLLASFAEGVALLRDVDLGVPHS